MYVYRDCVFNFLKCFQLMISCLTLRTADVYMFFIHVCFDIGSIMTYTLLVMWLDINITSAPYLRQRVFIIHFTVLFVIAFSAFHSIHSRIFHLLHIGAAFSSLAFCTPVFLTVPRFPFSHFQSPPSKLCAHIKLNHIPSIHLVG